MLTTLTFKAVDAAGNESPVEEVSVDFNPVKYKARVVRVIDGDTVEIEGGEKVRYIGIDAPESGGCFFEEATAKNREMVEGKEVKLEKDVSERDRCICLRRSDYL